MSLSKEAFKALTTVRKTDYGFFYETRTIICKYGQAFKTADINKYLDFYYPMYLRDKEQSAPQN